LITTHEVRAELADALMDDDLDNSWIQGDISIVGRRHGLS
jgi:hypothetical protein